MTTTPAVADATARYGDSAAALAVGNETIALQLAHRSVRRFLSEPVSDDQLTAIVAAAQSAPTSSNLQAWSVVAVRDPARKARLAALATGNVFIEQAPLFLVWLADLGRARRLAERAELPLDGADYVEVTLLAALDATLAAQNAIVAAESLGLGTCPVGAMRNRPEEVAAELGLPPHTFAVFGLAVGVPDPSERAGVKPRLPQSAVLHHETYSVDASDAALPTYDARLNAYNESVGMTGAWTDRVVRRLAGPQSLAGRHTLRETLARLGFPSR